MGYFMDSVTKQNSEQDTKNKEQGPITFQRGLPGLGEYREFNLFPIENNSLFYYLQSIKDPELGLIVIDPFPCFPDYSLELNEQDKKEIELEHQEDVLVFTTVTVLGEGKLTTNLSGPIVINARRRLAKQVIIPDRINEMRTPLLFETGEESEDTDSDTDNTDK